MANFINPENSEQKNFDPNVDNSKQIKAVSSMGAKIFWYALFILIIPIIVHIVFNNQLKAQQFKINEVSSGIDVQLKKRRDTLIKLVDSTKNYVKYEKEVLTKITEMRKSTFNSVSTGEEVSRLSGRILAVAENYPDLKANTMVSETMENAAYLEREIAAARRLYNYEVTTFNQSLVMFPKNIIAERLKLHSIKVFKASEEDRQDVEISF